MNVSMSCDFGGEKYPTPPQYDLNHPVTVVLSDEIDEISGIVYYPRDTSIFAIDDGTGLLYKIYPDRKASIQKWKLGKSHDFEDLQLVDSTFYILSSSGDLYVKTFPGDSLEEAEKIGFPGGSKNEFESLYYDGGLLNMICKNCKDQQKDQVHIWTFDPATRKFSLSPVAINTQPLAKRFNRKNLDLKPSAAAINPLTGELYILSSVNKVLVVTDKNGNIKNAYPLNPVIYKQPEGMAFTPHGDLLISNESADEGAANILVIKLKGTKS